MTCSDLHTGIHPCYKCTITNKEMQLPPDQRNSANSTVKTLESMVHDYDRFVAAGAKLKNAQHFNDVIRTPILDIEPDVRTCVCATKKFTMPVTGSLATQYSKCVLLA